MLRKRKKEQMSRYEKQARKTIKDRKRLLNLLAVALQKVIRDREALREAGREFLLAIRMLLKWLKGEYTRLPWRTLVALVAALLYFVNPFDLVPDTLLMMGYIDDIAVMNFVLRSVHRDVERFLEWEQRQQALLASTASTR